MSHAPNKFLQRTLPVVPIGLAACHPIPHVNPTSDPTCESHCALLPLGSSHGCKATHEALPHADPQLRSRRALQTHPHQLRSTPSSNQTEDCHQPLDLVPNPRISKSSKARCLYPSTNPHCVLFKNPTLPYIRSPWHDFPQPS